MKKVSKEKLIELLNDRTMTYKELSELTGYNQKYLIRLNKMIKDGGFSYAENQYNNIKDDIKMLYSASSFSSYINFYEYIKKRYNVSYSFVCKILKELDPEKEILHIKKVRCKNPYFIAKDVRTGTTILTTHSLKNDIKSTKYILEYCIDNYGLPEAICFENYFKNIPADIIRLLEDLKIEIVEYKKYYKTPSTEEPIPNYKQCHIDKYNFYNTISCETIDKNTINIFDKVYKIITKLPIPKATKLLLYYKDDYQDIFVMHKKKMYAIKEK